MPVEAIQCPKCGGPLSVEEGRDSVYCSHCGAGLRIATGSSGHAMATLADIKDDTSLLAVRAALERLEERLQERDNQLRQLETARAEACEQYEAEQQQQEQQHEERRARVTELRSQLRAGAPSEKILWALAVLCLAGAMYLICGSAYSIAAGADAGYHQVWSLALVTIPPVAFAGFFAAIAFSERAKQRNFVNRLRSAVQDEAAPGAESTSQKQEEALRRLDVEIDEIRSQIHEITSQRRTVRAKLDRLTDQL